MTTPQTHLPVHIPWAERILGVLDFIRSHLDEPLTPHDLAKHAGFSPHHFHRIFRGMVGQSVMEYVRHQRLERAAFRLKYGDRPIAEVALDAQYGSHEAFTRAFQARFDMAPRALRESAQHQQDPSLAIQLRHEPEQAVLCWQRTGPYDGSADAWNSLLAFAGLHQLFDAHTRLLGFVHDDPEIVPHERLRYDAAITLNAGHVARLRAVTLPEAARVGVLTGGRYALVVHTGPYHTSDTAYVSLLGRSLPRRTVDLADDPVIEVYLNSPMETPPDELRTEIMVRLV